MSLWQRLSKGIYEKHPELYWLPNRHMEKESEQNLSELYSALMKVHEETRDIVADATNPFHKSKYATLNLHLEYLKPIFLKHGLVVIQMPTSEFHDRGIGIKTIIAHKNGTSISTSCIVPVGEQATGQQAGAILTYLRRYCLAAIAGVATTEDDDCESDRVVKAPAAKPAAPKAASAPKAAPATSGEPDFNLQVPFGKNKGSSLQDLADNDLDYWANKWEPRPFEKTGKVTQRDALLKKSAQALWAIRSSGGTDTAEDEVPF